MRAIGLTAFGGPEVLRLLDLPPEPLAPGQVRIRVDAATVNPTDALLRSGALAAHHPRGPEPIVPGMEAAGVVTELAPGPDGRLAVGEPVTAIVVPRGSHGAYREDLVLPAESVVRAPKGADAAAAATLPMNGLTARLALDALALAPGSVLVVSGAAGAVGGYVLQLARAAGLTVVADAAPGDEELVRGLGADVVLPRGTTFAGHVRERFPAGADAVVDGANQQAELTAVVRDGGQFLPLRPWAGDGLRDVRFPFVAAPRAARDTAALEGLRQAVDDGVLTLRVARTVPADHAARAHRELAAGGLRGRLVLTF